MMKRLLLLLVFCLSLSLQAAAPDEGMWPISDIHKLNLKDKGLLIEPSEIFNPNGVSLIDGIVMVGGCTGSFVSPDGLDVPHRDHAGGERESGPLRDGGGNVGGFCRAGAADHVEPSREIACVGLGGDGGEVEVGVGVDEAGDEEAIGEMDASGVGGGRMAINLSRQVGGENEQGRSGTGRIDVEQERGGGEGARGVGEGGGVETEEFGFRRAGGRHEGLRKGHVREFAAVQSTRTIARKLSPGRRPMA